jgi:acetoacetate decarboxylase
VIGHPPAPWRLMGPAAIVPALVPLAKARAHVPDDLQIVRVLPGHTLGGFVAVTYEHGSTLMYNEIVVCGALVRTARGRVGLWVSGLWVDSESSVSGGRQIWKLPKDLGSFEVDRTRGRQRFEASVDGRTIVRIRASKPPLRLPQPGILPMVSGTVGSHWFTVGRGVMKAGVARVRVEVPPDSPIASLGLKPLPLAIAGRSRLVMDAPSPAS